MSCSCVSTAHEPTTTAEIATSSGRPRLDVVETSDAFRVDVEIPGAGKDDVELRTEKGVLSIRARVPSTNGTPGRYHVREHGSREFVRELGLGDAIDAERISAEVARGLLTIHLPKVAAVTPRRVEVR
jgi:HSP20 family protein